MINWTTITNRTEYENKRYESLLWTEEQGRAKLIPYNDKAAPLAAGNITIGVGFNLEGSTAVRDEVFLTFGLIRNNPALSTTPPAPGQLSAQQVENNYIDQLVAAIGRMVDDPSELNSIMAARAGDSRLAALGARRSTFSFNDEPEIRATFDRLMTNIYELKVNNWLSGIPDSRESTALISLAWNQKDSSPLLGNKLKAAVTNGDRAEAWYEIRYNSNSASQPANIRNGIAKRRYFEADTFSLYNDATAANDQDAKGAFRTYTRHKPAMDQWEASHTSDLTNAAALGAPLGITVQNLAGDLSNARAYLYTTYLAPVSPGLVLDGDILVGEDNGTTVGDINTLYYRKSDDDASLTGTDQNDLLFGESGNDILDGKGGGDVFYGGSGMDIYKYRPNDGNDVIVDSDGKGAILFDPEGSTPQLLAFGIRNNTDPAGQYKSPDGSITYTVNGSDLSITNLAGTVNLTVKNFSQDHREFIRVNAQ